MIAIALVVSILVLFVLEMVGVRHAKAGKVDTVSELYWWTTDHVPEPVRWGINLVLVAVLAWTGTHLICRCGI